MAFGDGQQIAQTGQDLSRAVRDLLREIENLNRTVRDSTRGGGGGGLGGGGLPGGGGGGGAPAGGGAAGGLAGPGLGAAQIIGGGFGAVGEFLSDNFVTNAAKRAAKNFAIDTSAGVANDFFRFGPQSFDFSDSLQSSALRAATNLPGVGDAFGDIQDPKERTKGRVKGVLSDIARAGGTVTDKDIDELIGAFAPEETRAQEADRTIERRFRSEDVTSLFTEGAGRAGAVVDAVGAAADGRLGEALDKLIAAFEGATSRLNQVGPGAQR
ncbi:MAG TPA: hypothetical protein VEA38_12100 [Terriglobales bacterium]|nr:hypothetical protein [Terriglobales bacterium]